MIQVEFDRDFLPGATDLPDSGGYMQTGEGKNGRVRWNRIMAPALLSEQLVIVTVYGPRARLANPVAVSRRPHLHGG